MTTHENDVASLFDPRSTGHIPVVPPGALPPSWAAGGAPPRHRIVMSLTRRTPPPMCGPGPNRSRQTTPRASQPPTRSPPTKVAFDDVGAAGAVSPPARKSPRPSRTRNVLPAPSRKTARA